MAEFFKSWWLLAGLIPAAFFVFLFCVSVFEKRLIRPYVAAPDDENFLAPSMDGDPLGMAGLPRASQVSDYVGVMSAAIHAAGFAYHGLVAHAKAPMIQILATVWMSSDRMMVVLSGSGSVIKMPAHQTWIFTTLRGGKWLVSTDNTDDGDPSGHWLYKRVINVPFARLLESHLGRLRQFGSQIEPFAERDAIDALFALYERHVRQMVGRGIAKYCDAAKTRWSYTAKGGLLVCLGFFRTFFGAFLQAHRVQAGPIASPELKTAIPPFCSKAA